MDTFLARVTVEDSFDALSDAKFAQLSDASRTLVIEDDGTIVAVGVAAEHLQGDSTSQWEVETVLDRGLRFAEFEDRLLASALTLVPVPHLPSVWSHRHSFDAALERAGFVVVRELAQMTVELPIAGDGSDLMTRTFEPDDAKALIAVNRQAFQSHREAASLSEADVSELMGEEGFDASGLHLLEDNREIIGFCWTRIHEGGDGEIYRIAVLPEFQGTGLGKSLLLRGFAQLARQSTVKRGMLWVDASNGPAMSLYTGIGMTQTATNREFERTTEV